MTMGEITCLCWIEKKVNKGEDGYEECEYDNDDEE